MNRNQVVGEILKEIRKSRKYSLKYVGDKIGRSRYTVRDYESGETEMYWYIFEKICAVYGVSVSDISSKVRTDPRLDKDQNEPLL